MASFTPDGQMQTVWHIRIGATFKKQYQWKTGDPATPVDLTGWTARSHIRAKIADTAALTTLTTETGEIVLTPQGEIQLELSEAQSKLLTGNKSGVFDLELESPTGFVRNLVGGSVVFYAEVTRED